MLMPHLRQFGKPMTETYAYTLPVGSSSPHILKRLRRLAWMMDSSIRIPGTSLTLGLDAVLSVAPGIGSLAGTMISAYMLVEAVRMGLPLPKLARMGANIAIDTVMGAIPVGGFFFDMFFKSNMRNMAILREHLGDRL